MRERTKAWDSATAEQAERVLRNLARRLDHDAPGVSASILESAQMHRKKEGEAAVRRSFPAAMVAIQANTWIPLGSATAMLAAEKNPSDRWGIPEDSRGEHVMDPQAETEEGCGDERNDDQVISNERRSCHGRNDHRHCPAAGRKMM